MKIKFYLSDAENILLNLSAGMTPKDLTKKERKLLEKEYGEDWLFALGYETNLDYIERKAKEKKLI